MCDLHNFCNFLIKKFNLFWQYPVITEKTVFLQQKNNPNYIGLPWATIIDKRINVMPLLKILKSKLKSNKEYITCCQHISFRNIKNYYNFLGIKILYIPHKIKSEHKLNNIILRACPLYAVNLEDSKKNSIFKNKDLLNKKRKFLYSFIGGYQNGYLTKIRLNIFNMKHLKNCFIKHNGDWHFNKIVYGKQVKNRNMNNKEIKVHNIKTELYNRILVDSRYSLCPSGSGPNSIRFWESLGSGAIPILLSDTLELPKHELWENTIIKLKERNLQQLPNILSLISEEKEKEMRANCLKIYKELSNNFI